MMISWMIGCLNSSKPIFVTTDVNPEWMDYEPPTEAFEFEEIIGKETAAPSHETADRSKQQETSRFSQFFGNTDGQKGDEESISADNSGEHFCSSLVVFFLGHIFSNLLPLFFFSV